MYSYLHDINIRRFGFICIFNCGFVIRHRFRRNNIKFAGDGRCAANATYLTGFDAGIGLGTIVSGLICSAAGYGHMYLCLGLPVVIALILYAVFNRKNKQSIAENLIISAAEEEE